MYKGQFGRRIAAITARRKKLLFVCFDVLALVAVLWLSFSFRLNHFFIPNLEQALLMLAAPAIALPIFIRMGLYRSVLRYLPERAIWTILSAVTVATLVWVSLAFLTQMTGLAGVPRSVALFYWVLGVCGDRRQPVRGEVAVLGASGAASSCPPHFDLRYRQSRDAARQCADLQRRAQRHRLRQRRCEPLGNGHAWPPRLPDVRPGGDRHQFRHRRGHRHHAAADRRGPARTGLAVQLPADKVQDPACDRRSRRRQIFDRRRPRHRHRRSAAQVSRACRSGVDAQRHRRARHIDNRRGGLDRLCAQPDGGAAKSQEAHPHGFQRARALRDRPRDRRERRFSRRPRTGLG